MAPAAAQRKPNGRPERRFEASQSLSDELISESIGCEIYELAAAIYPICRSITGDGVRATLRLLSAHVDLQVHEVPTGTVVFDWTIPREWNIRDAYIKNSRGTKIVDFAQSNLHVMSYSQPVRKCVSLAELKKHLHTLPAQPDLIPYRTTYYSENWGFCLPVGVQRAIVISMNLLYGGV